MADRRKLQGEVERCLKKVAEGCEAFEDYWQKVQNATNINQKEKYESELKKEIKKLQRLREQIKTWVASNDIKDKKPLTENRKLIEIQMERFRIVEKETKTKAYSKEGLGQANKIDPETKEFERCRDWLNEALKNLEYQIDQYETEIESLNAATKKKKIDKDKLERMDELTDRIEKHRYHIAQLEHILRLLDNHSLEVETVNEVRDDVEYYIETCQEPDFVDDEGIYDDLDLEPETDLEASLRGDNEREEDHDTEPSPSSSLNSGFSPLSKSNSSSPRKNSKSLLNGSTPVTTPSKRNLFPSTSESTTSADNTKVNGLDHPTTEANTTSSSFSTTTTSTPSTKSSVSIATSEPTLTTASTTVSSSTTATKEAREASPPKQQLSSVEQNALQVVRSHVESLKSQPAGGNQLWRTNSSSSDTTETPIVASLAFVTTSTAVLPTEPTPVVASSTPVITSSSAIVRPKSTIAVTTTSVLPTVTPNSNEVFQPISSLSDQQLPLEFQAMKGGSLFGGAPPSLQKPAPQDTQEVRLQPVHGVAPLGPVLLTQDRLYQLKLLDSAFHHLPQKQDSERMRPYISRSAVPIATYHLHQPPPNIDSIEFFQRLSTETLFFIFYYQEGTRAQYLAAKALKKQSWRFHTKYMMWFQRHEEPKRITDEFEEGTYIFFDYEKWSQRKRDGFTFEYRFLEDKDLP